MNKRKRRKKKQSKKKITVSSEYSKTEIEVQGLLQKEISTKNDEKVRIEEEIEFFTQTLSKDENIDTAKEVSPTKSQDTPLASETLATQFASSYIQVEDVSPVEQINSIPINLNPELLFIPSKKLLNISLDDDDNGQDKDLELQGLFVDKVEIQSNSNHNRLVHRFWEDSASDCVTKPNILKNFQNYTEDKQLYKSHCDKVFNPIYYPPSNVHLSTTSDSELSCKISFKELKLTEHPLFTEEHKVAHQLDSLFRNYSEKLQQNLIPKLELELSTLREIIKDFIERNQEDDLSDLEDYIIQARNLRYILHKEEKCQRYLLKSILDTWKSIKGIRARQGYNLTNIKLIIRTIKTDLDEEERLWNRRFEIELSEMVREAYEQYYREKRNRKSNKDELKGIQHIVRKPDIDDIREELLEIFQYCVRDPSEPKLLLDIGHIDVTSSNLVKTKRYYLKLILDGHEIGSTRNYKLNHNFSALVDESYSIILKKRIPRDIKIEIYEKSKIPLDLKIAEIHLPYSRLSEYAIKYEENIEFASIKHNICGTLKIVFNLSDQENELTWNQSHISNRKLKLSNDIIQNWYDENLIDPLDPDCYSILEGIKGKKPEIGGHIDDDKDELFILNEDVYAFCSQEQIENDLRLKMLSARFNSDMRYKDYKLVPVFERELAEKSDEKVVNDADWGDPIDLQRHKGKKFLIELYNTISNHCEQLNKSQDAANLLIGDQPPTISSIISNIMGIFGPSRPLNPAKKPASSKISLNSKSFHNFNIVVNIVRATGVPVRNVSPTMARRNSSVSLIHQSFKFANVRPYISLVYKDKAARTISVDGSNPTWNEELVLSISGTLSELKGDIKFQLFDEYVEDLINGDRVRATEVYQRIYGKWLAELRLPITTILSRQQVEGVFELDAPKVLIGYTRPSLDPTEGAIAIENVPEIRDVIYLSLYINIEPQFEIPFTTTTHLESSELKDVKIHIQEWCLELRDNFPDRYIDPLVSLSNGKRVCVTRLLEPIPLPFTANDNAEKMVTRYVSLFPIVKSVDSCVGLNGIWLNNQLILDTTWASPKDLGVLLACFYISLGIQTWLVLGTGFPYGEMTFVLLREAFSYYVVDPCSGKKYSCKDTLCPLTKVLCIVNQNNVYSNVQTENRVSMTDFNIDDSSNWMPLFSKSNPAPMGGVHDLGYMYKNSFSTVDIRKNIERKIMKKMNSWRSNRKTIWNRSLHDLFYSILHDLEQDVIFDRPPTNYMDRVSEAIPSYKVSGFTLNFPYINLSSISERIKSTGIHLNADKRVEFSVCPSEKNSTIMIALKNFTNSEILISKTLLSLLLQINRCHVSFNIYNSSSVWNILDQILYKMNTTFLFTVADTRIALPPDVPFKQSCFHVIYTPTIEENDLKEIIQIQTTSTYWNFSANILVTAIQPAKFDKILFLNMFKIFSRSNMINVAIIYYDYHDKRVNIFKTSDYQNQGLVNMTNITDISGLFLDKTLNLQGYILNISQYNDYPRSFINKNGVITGTDGYILNLICAKINCSYQITGPAPSNKYDRSVISFYDLKNNIAEIGFNLRIILSTNFWENPIKLLHSQQIDFVVLLVPGSPPLKSYKNLIEPLSPMSWLYVCLTFFGYSILLKMFKIFNRNDNSLLSDIIGQTFRLQFLIPLRSIPRSTKERLFLLGFTFYSMVLLNGYQSVLTSYLMSPRYEPDIQTIQEALKLNISFSVPVGYRKLLADVAKDIPIINKLIENNYSIWSVKNRHTNTDTLGYVTLSRHAKFFMQTEANIQNGRKLLHMVPEGIAYSTSGYFIRKNMPYENTMNNILIRISESGILQKFQTMSLIEYDHVQNTYGIIRTGFKGDGKFVRLGFQEIQIALGILFIGYTVAMLIFLFELFKKHFLNRIKLGVNLSFV